MNISAIGAQPYIYNVNAIGSSSMNRISAISDDVLTSKVDYSGLTGENENELPIGKSKNFADIIMQQMSLSEANATRVMQQPEEELLEEMQESASENIIEEMNYRRNEEPSLYQRQNAAKMYEMNIA